MFNKQDRSIDMQQLAAVVELAKVMKEIEQIEEPPQEQAPDPEPEPEIKPEPEPEPEPVQPEPEPEPEPLQEPEPEPEPVQPPQPQPEPEPLKMDKIFETQKAEAPETPGDFATGSQETKHNPELRIDWGSAQTALNIIKSGGMRLVVYSGAASSIHYEYVNRSGQWRRQRLAVNRRLRFSNRIRIVQDVPAFSKIIQGDDWKEKDRLAIMVPRDIEQMLQSAQLTAASTQGLTMRDIHSFAGRFQLVNSNQLNFDVTAIRVRMQ
ncbi:hypothetical protein [Poriferisphaera corsica]|uniref:hypothetical protein n=1 Tax=Poriferisphaera corsica TaxID=2528020 RepID=UPI00190CD426|nr:hypothetical protein [Poriferisphaera corsica]